MECNCYVFNSDLSKWDVSSVVEMSSMFNSCENFNSDLSKWDVSNVRYMTGMFNHCPKFCCDLSEWEPIKRYIYSPIDIYTTPLPR